MRNEDILNSSQACELLNISRPTLEKAIADGIIPALRVGSHWRISKKAIQEKMRGQ